MKQICKQNNYKDSIQYEPFYVFIRFELIVLRARGVHFDLRQNSATKTMVLLTRSGAFVEVHVHTISFNKGSKCGPTLQKSVLKIEPPR